jgi:ATP-dependent helicase HrpA
MFSWLSNKIKTFFRITAEYQQLVGKLGKGQAIPEEVSNVRWMIEELRISYFAQVLGTPYPVSDKRVLQAIEAIKI